MQFSSARFVSVIGTEVHANPSNNAEARIALKELRQKKKEFTLRKRALAAQAKSARDAAERAEGTPSQNKKRGIFAALGRLFRKAKARTPKKTLTELEADLTQADEILFNLDSCAIQIEGKLLQTG